MLARLIAFKLLLKVGHAVGEALLQLDYMFG